jgi:hypothetical protein
VSEKSGSGSGDNGFRGLLEGRFGADDQELCSVGRKWLYIFNRRKDKKLIPDKSLTSWVRVLIDLASAVEEQ